MVMSRLPRMPHIILHGMEITAINRPTPAPFVAPLTGGEDTEDGYADIVIRKRPGSIFKAGLFGEGVTPSPTLEQAESAPAAKEQTNRQAHR
jgi:hypothetical protein